MKRTFGILLISVMALPLAAQNLNPEVVVTNDYVTRLLDVDKKQVKMNLPDSMTKFDYHFDYSVFDSPYKGAYEFTPYSVKVSPRPSALDARSFYLDAGMGYAMCPHLEAVWEPVRRKRFDLSAYSGLEGFAGRYNPVDASSLVADMRNHENGYDLEAVAGVEGRWNTKKMALKFRTGYEGLFTGYAAEEGIMNSATADLRVMSTAMEENMLCYDVNLSYRFLHDINSGMNNVAVHELGINGLVGQKWGDYRFMMDFEIGADGYFTAVNFTPRFDFKAGPFDLSAGATFSYAEKFSVYPRLKAGMNVFGNSSRLYLDVTGRTALNSYSSLKTFNHRYNLSYGRPEVTRERVLSSLGLRGSIGKYTRYDVNAGFDSYANLAMHGVTSDILMLEGISFANYSQLHAGARIGWDSDRVEAEARFLFRYGTTRNFADFSFAPSRYSGGLKFIYNWNRRIYAGLMADAESNRVATVPYITGKEYLYMPWYVDLQARFEYRFTHKWALWLRGGNLLGMDIRTSPMYSPRGRAVTAGFTLAL